MNAEHREVRLLIHAAKHHRQMAELLRKIPGRQFYGAHSAKAAELLDLAGAMRRRMRVSAEVLLIGARMFDEFELDGVTVRLRQQDNLQWAYERRRKTTNELLSTRCNYPTRKDAEIAAKRGVGEI